MLSKTSIGVDFQENQIIVSALRKKRGQVNMMQIQLLRAGENGEEGVPIPYMAAREELQLQLKMFLSARQLKKAKRRPAHFAVPSRHAVLRRITALPDWPIEKIKQIMPFEVAENIHLPFADPVYDVIKIGSFSATAESDNEIAWKEAAASLQPMEGQESGRMDKNSDLLLFAASHTLVDTLAESLRKARIKPLSAEVKGLSLQRFIRFLQPDWLQDLEIVVEIREPAFDLHVFHGGVLMFSSHVELNMRDYLRKSQDAAFSLRLEDRDDFETDQYLSDLAEQIGRAVDFSRHYAHNWDQPVRRIVLLGKGGSAWRDRLSSRIGLPVDQPDLEKLRQGKYYPEELLNMSAVSIGLALRGLGV